MKRKVSPHDAKMRSSGGRRLASMRWELGKAAIEFGTDPRTLLGKLERAGCLPDGEGKYGTRQLLNALYDDQFRNRTAMLKAQGEKLEISNQQRRGDLIPRREVMSFCRELATGLRPLVVGMAAPDQDKQRVFQYLAALENGGLLERVRQKKAG